MDEEVVVISDSDCEAVVERVEENQVENLSPNARLERSRRVLAAGGAEPSRCARRPLPKPIANQRRRAEEARVRNQLVEQLRQYQVQQARRERRILQRQQREERRRQREARVRFWERPLRARRPKAKPAAKRARDRDQPTRNVAMQGSEMDLGRRPLR